MANDPAAPKLLADLLALSVSDNDAEAAAALTALRRRAARDGLTAGTLKQMIDTLMQSAPRAAPADIDQLRWTIANQEQDLAQSRTARRDAEAAMRDSQRANATLAEQVGGIDRARRRSFVGGLLVGLATAALAFGAITWLTARPVLVAHAAHPGLSEAAADRLVAFLRSCVLSSVNNMGGTGFDMHVLIDVNAAGRVAGFALAPGQNIELGDADRKLYSELVARTIAGGSCGVLPLPASLAGRATRLDLYLTR